MLALKISPDRKINFKDFRKYLDNQLEFFSKNSLKLNNFWNVSFCIIMAYYIEILNLHLFVKDQRKLFAINCRLYITSLIISKKNDKRFLILSTNAIYSFTRSLYIKSKCQTVIKKKKNNYRIISREVRVSPNQFLRHQRMKWPN